MRVLLGLIMMVILGSCYKETIVPQQPIDPQPIITDTLSSDSTVSLKNTTWIITKVLNTDLNEEFRSDTLFFISNNDYSFNGVKHSYSFYPNNSNYTLTLNNTPWGHISGTIYEYNLSEGYILNCQFRDYYTGQNIIKIWMVKN